MSWRLTLSTLLDAGRSIILFNWTGDGIYPLDRVALFEPEYCVDVQTVLWIGIGDLDICLSLVAGGLMERLEGLSSQKSVLTRLRGGWESIAKKVMASFSQYNVLTNLVKS